MSFPFFNIQGKIIEHDLQNKFIGLCQCVYPDHPEVATDVGLLHLNACRGREKCKIEIVLIDGLLHEIESLIMNGVREVSWSHVVVKTVNAVYTSWHTRPIKEVDYQCAHSFSTPCPPGYCCMPGRGGVFQSTIAAAGKWTNQKLKLLRLVLPFVSDNTG